MRNQRLPIKSAFATLVFSTLIGGVVPVAHAQVIRFKTYEIGYLHSAAGEYRPPFKLAKIKADESDRFRRYTKEEEAYMEQILSDYVGKSKECAFDLYFLPGNTESSFRAAEKTLAKGVTTTGFTSKTDGRTTKYVLKKSYPVKKFANGSVSFYIYESYLVRHKQDMVHVYAFVYSKEAKQGSLMICNANNSK